MANNATPKLKAYVQVDSTGRVVSGTPVFRASKPKSGNWREIPLYYRGDNLPTTTTTTTGGGVTPTAFIKPYWLNTNDSCNSTIYGNLLFYSLATSLAPEIRIYTDATLTSPVATGLVIADGMFTKYVVGGGGLIYLYNCPPPSTSYTGYGAFSSSDSCNQSNGNPSVTLYANANLQLDVSVQLFSNSQLSVPYSGGNGNYFNVNQIVYQVDGQGIIVSKTACSTSFIGRVGNTSGEACSGTNETFYSTGPLQYGVYPQAGNRVYLDQALTQPVTSAYLALPGIGAVFQVVNAVLSNQSTC